MEIFRKAFEDSIKVREKIFADNDFQNKLADTARLLKEVTAKGGTIYSCGNGGSSCDAMHLSEELVARYHKERPGIKAMHFGDPGTLTCWGNDYSYETAFKRCAETFCTSSDVLIGISTSGNSKNVIMAVEAAKEKGSKTIGFLGKDGGVLKSKVDIPLIVPSDNTARIQEVHITLVHILCEMIEEKL